MVEDTVNGKDNMEEKTSEVADIRRYHFNWNFSTTQDVICCCDCVRPERFFVNSWNMYDNIKDMQVDVRQHCGRWGQQAREDQGIRWHQDVSLLLKFFHLGCGVMWLWWFTWQVFHIFFLNMFANIKVNCVSGRQHCRWQGQPGRGDHGGQWHQYVSLQL